MSKYFLLLFTSACMISVSVLPTWADDTTSSTPSKKKVVNHWKTVPKAIAGFCTGAIVGTPICFVRKLPEETVEGAHGLVGSIVDDKNDPFLLVPAGILWSPLAGIVTMLEAPVYSFRDAWMAEQPFSKEQFSLGKLDSPKTTDSK